jgi:hypothetical protein
VAGSYKGPGNVGLRTLEYERRKVYLPSPRVHLVLRRGTVMVRVSTSAMGRRGIGGLDENSTAGAQFYVLGDS